MINYKHYTYRITWSEEDQEHIALCAEFPSLSYLAAKPEKALEGLFCIISEIIEDMAENGEPIPEPIAHKTYSGKFQIRIPPEQHRKLAIKAAEEGTSLNRYISSCLT